MARLKPDATTARLKPGTMPARRQPHDDLPHESARGHVTGEALYTDDLIGRFPHLLHAWPVIAPHAHARVHGLDVANAISRPGVVTVLTEDDVPGEGDTGAARHDEPLFPREVMFHSQPVAWVLGETLDAARAAAALVSVSYEALPAILTIADAIAAEQLSDRARFASRAAIPRSSTRARSDSRASWRSAGRSISTWRRSRRLPGSMRRGGVAVESSTQHPAETQEIVARVLGVAKHQVSVQCIRMGGAFGGKEVQANAYAAVAALGARKTGRPVRVRLPRHLDMVLTGKRHPYLARYDAGFSPDGRIEALRLQLYSDGGWSLDLSEPIMWRSLFHCDNAYYLPAVDAVGWVCRTHKTSQTAFRGFGGPQAMVVIEDVLSQAAAATRRARPMRSASAISIAMVRPRITDRSWKMPRALRASGTSFATPATSTRRRDEIARFNAAHPHTKRGLAMTPAKFGISFTATFYNQGGALVLVYRDGSVQVNHGGTEMGQGLFTKVQRIAADTLGLPLASVRMMPTRTDKVPNTSATAASAGTDLNGAAVLNACRQVKDRLVVVAAGLLRCEPEAVRIEAGIVRGGDAGRSIPFAELCETAYKQRVPLFAHGFYRTPDIHFDPATGRGRPFYYFAYGAAVSEVEVDGFTGDYRLLRTDIVQDVGDSVAPIIDRGQVEGGFMQGVGWLTIEELLWDSQGRVATAGASTYKLPSWSEVPDTFNVTFLPRATQPGVVFGSKAVGEPPLMLAISVREALRAAVQAFVPPGSGGQVDPITFDSPATPERIFFAVQRARRQNARPRRRRTHRRVTITDLNGLGRDAFVAAIGWVFEHSPWVADARVGASSLFVPRESPRGDGRVDARGARRTSNWRSCARIRISAPA